MASDGKVLRRFRGIPNRLELIRTIKGVKYYNDTTATNPDATIAALKTLGYPLSGRQKIILIAGGADKNLDFKEVTREIKKTCQKVMMLNGTATPRFIRVLENNHFPEKRFCHLII